MRGVVPKPLPKRMPLPAFKVDGIYIIKPIGRFIKTEDKEIKRDRRYRFKRIVGRVALFEHLKGRYLEAFTLTDIQDHRVRVKFVG